MSKETEQEIERIASELKQHNIKAKEAPAIKKRMFSGLFDRFKYDVKKMEVIAGKYELNHKVILKQKALIKALVYMVTVMRESNGSEYMGLLVGKREGNQIIIEDSWIGDCMSTSYSTELSWKDRIALQKKAKAEGLQIVGWVHSHPFGFSSPSAVDTATNYAWEKSIQEPVMLIVSPSNFTIGTTHNRSFKKLDFVIPPSTDNSINLNLGYINREPTMGEMMDSNVIYDYSELELPTMNIYDFWFWIGDTLFLFFKSLYFQTIGKLFTWRCNDAK